jgi:hypothetical protein
VTSGGTRRDWTLAKFSLAGRCGYPGTWILYFACIHCVRSSTIHFMSLSLAAGSSNLTTVLMVALSQRPSQGKRSVQPRVMASSAPLYNRLIQLGTRSFKHELGKN